MISSGGVDGSERSILPNPASSGIGVKLSLSCAPADKASTPATANANHHRFLPFDPQRVRAAAAPSYHIRRIYNCRGWAAKSSIAGAHGDGVDVERCVPRAALLNPLFTCPQQ